MIRLAEIKTVELSTYGNFAMCHQALFRVLRVGLGTRLMVGGVVFSTPTPRWPINFPVCYICCGLLIKAYLQMSKLRTTARVSSSVIL